MILPESDYQILRLTARFYENYPNPPYKELMLKPGRRYTCLLFQTHYDYFICVPYRSNVKHPFAFHFHQSKRSQKQKSALDYTKIVIIKQLEYLDSKQGYVDKDEYLETVRNLRQIKAEALAYVEDYVAEMCGQSRLHPKEFQRKYSRSALPYFHKELGIGDGDEV